MRYSDIKDKRPYVIGLNIRQKAGNKIYRYRRAKHCRYVGQEVMDYYTPTNPRTPLQQNWRATFAEAMAAWQALTESEKDAYRSQAKPKHLLGHNLFIRLYITPLVGQAKSWTVGGSAVGGPDFITNQAWTIGSSTVGSQDYVS